MAKIKAIQAFRPAKGKEKDVASQPYDVLNSKEAKLEAGSNPHSFLRIIKSEIDFEDGVDVYSDKIYQRAKDNFEKFVKTGVLVQDQVPCLYFYKLVMDDISQIGLVCGSSIDDYFNDVIKKHEYTRPKKEKDRIKHIKTSEIHAGPVFLTYKANKNIDQIAADYLKNNKADVNFTATDDIQHSLWVLDDPETINEIIHIFNKEIPATYIADGHHRAASTSKVGKMLSEENPNHTGKEEYNSFLSVLFPDNQVNIIDYNRVVKDLNGMSEKEFLSKLSERFEVKSTGKEIFKPKKVKEFGMYLSGSWYNLQLKNVYGATEDPVESLDTSLLQDHLFGPLLGIKDQRTDERIDFVGGIRGMKELEKRVDSGDVKVAFSIFPVSIKQLFDVADSGNVMPPKSTWFEPKLRSGLVVYKYK